MSHDDDNHRPEGAPDPLADAEMKAALEQAKQRRKAGEDPLFYTVEENARRGAEGEAGERVYVEPRTVHPARPGKETQSRVKLAEQVDPRRAMTLPSAKHAAVDAGAVAAGAAEMGARAGAPSSKAPLSRDVKPTKRRPAWGVIAAGVVLAGVAAAIALRGPRGNGEREVGGPAATASAPLETSVPATAVPSAPSAPSVTMSATAASVTNGAGAPPRAPGTSGAAAASTGVQVPPRTSADPYGDVGSPPKPPSAPTPPPAVSATGPDVLQPTIRF